MFAVTRAARQCDRSLVASAGCHLIPWDGTASTVPLGSVCLVAPSFPCPEKGMQPRWDFSPPVFPGRCPVVDGRAPGKEIRGICVKRVVLRKKVMLGL